MESVQMDIKYVRIAEIVENIEKANQQIELHEKTTKNNSVIRQYCIMRDEFIVELQEIFKALNLRVVIAPAA